MGRLPVFFFEGIYRPLAETIQHQEEPEGSP